MTRARARLRAVRRAAARAAPRAAVACALAVAACATTPPDPDARTATGLALAPYASHEECLALRAGDRLDYRFHTDLPVAFNIHYSESHAIVMPLQREAVTVDSGIYQPVLAHDFCLAWQAGSGGATLDYRVGVRRRGT